MGTANAPFIFMVPLLILLVLLVSLVGLLYLWYRVFKGRLSGAGGDLSTCGKCGYAVRGLQGLNCPECGADLREVGIVTPKHPGGVSLVLFVLLWTLLLCVVSELLTAVGPHTITTSQSESITPIISGHYQSITFYASGKWPYPEVEIEFHAARHSEVIQVDLVAMLYTETDSHSRQLQSQPLDTSSLLVLLKNVGADIIKQHVRDEADELLTSLQGFATSGNIGQSLSHFTHHRSHGTHSIEPATWFRVLMVIFWIVVWIAGFWLYFRIRRKHQPGSTGQVALSQAVD